MHQNRRRKKRPSYGIRTVEITRSRSGFGFTISGQAPCILSCIVSCSPAEQVGLRPGDYLIAVNGQNVSKAPHDDVVRLIGNSSGVLKLQIAENYYSDSSEDEIMAVSRSKLKYPNRVRTKQHHVHRAERVVQDLQAGLLFERGQLIETSTKKNYTDFKNLETQLLLCTNTTDKRASQLHEKPRPLLSHDNSPVNVKQHSKKRERKTNGVQLQNSSSGKENLCNRYFIEQELNDVLYPSLQPSSWEVYLEEALYRAVVGYLGTIEMPKEPQIPGTRLQAVRKCIRRLRIEKKVHTLVLLTVFIEKITLTNPHGLTIAEYPAEKISFSGVYADDKKFFGLVTSQKMSVEDANEESHAESITVSNSCHVFMIDPRMISHEAHANRAKMFSLECCHDPRYKCREFPDSADPILRAILSVYRNHGDGHVDFASGLVDVDAGIVHQHSNTSSNSSNSDSGIGFRDDAHHSDQVFVVDVNDIPQRVPFSTISSGTKVSPCASQANKEEKLLRATKESADAASNFNQSNKLDRLTVRVMPNPVGYPILDMNSNERKCFPKDYSKTAKIVDCVDSDEFSKPFSLPPTVLNIHRTTPVGCSLTTIPTDLHLHKLSPKVYNVEFAVTPSCQSPLPLVDRLPLIGDATEGSQDVHPPTQDEGSECSELENISHGPETSKRWMRTSSLRRQFSKRISPHISNESGAMSDGELVNGKLSTCSSMLGFDGVSLEGSVEDGVSGASGSSAYGSERNCSHSRVASWAISFEKLLNDPAGVHTLAEFLKKEFSHENIYFWVACERYRKYASEDEMKEKACEIFKRHLCLGAPEPVNVDSHARQLAQEGLYHPSKDIFVQAQKQGKTFGGLGFVFSCLARFSKEYLEQYIATNIYNLMKFDCYSRFLKSPLYKECVMAELSGTSLPLLGDDKLDPGIPYDKDAKCKPKVTAKDDIEEHRRKSLLPWHRRSSKNKDGKGIIKNGELRKSYRRVAKDQADDASDASGSRISLASNDLVQRESLSAGDTLKFSAKCIKSGSTLCRVILPDQSTTVVQTKNGDSVYALLQGLLEKRGLQYSAIEVFSANSGQAIDLSEDSSILGCCEVVVEQRVIFCLDLHQKTLAVRARPTLPLSHVLHPILHRYQIKIEDVIIQQVGLEKPTDLSILASNVDKQHLTVQSKEDYGEWGKPDNRSGQLVSRSIQPTRCLSVSDETSGQSWADALLGKSFSCFDDLGVLDLDLVKSSTKVDEKASRSSGFFGLVRRNSIHFDRDVSKRAKTKGIPCHRASVHESINYGVVPSAKPAASRQAVVERNENDELFAIWKRAERSRLDDQRGTEINFELPDFLKPKTPLDGSEPIGRRFGAYDAHWSDGSDNGITGCKDDVALRGISLCNESFTVDGILPTQQQAEELFSSMCSQTGSPIFRDPKMTEKSLQEIGFEFHSRAEIPVCMVQPKKLVPRPSSHPMPHFSSRTNVQQVIDFPLEKNAAHLSCKSLVVGNASLSSKELSNDSSESNFQIALKENSIHTSCRQFVQDAPPPLPPKPKLPPPRSVSLLNKLTPAGSENLEGAASGHVVSQLKRPDLLTQISQKSSHVDCDTSERFSISFV